MHVVVVGAGISGLAAAYALRRDAPEIDVTIVDGAPRIGGKLRTSQIGGVAVDEGAEAFVLRAPEGQALAREVGLADQLVSPAAASAALVTRGELRPLPTGTLLGIPTEAGPITDTLGEQAAHAVIVEPDLPGPLLTEDVSVGELVRRRLGALFVEQLVDPLLGGVYAGRADQLSLRATMPAVAAGLAEHPSVARAATAALHAAQQASTPGSPVFGTVRGGMDTLAEAVRRASGAEVRLRLPARDVLRTARGFRVLAGPAPAPTVLDADGVIVAAPAPKAASMLAESAPWASHELTRIEYASLAIVTLAYPKSAGAVPPGSGMLVPVAAGRTVKALTYSSQKWAHLAEAAAGVASAGSAGHVILRASIGRHGDERTLHCDDRELVASAAHDIAELTSLAGPAGLAGAPVACRVSRWGGGLPQYAVGHTERVRRIFDDVAKVPGLAVCGAAYDGVGIPACIRSGQAAAKSVLSSLRADSGGLREGSGGLRESKP